MFGKSKPTPLSLSWTSPLSVGDIIRVDGRRYQITKKTSTAVAAVPYSVFDEFCDWLGKKLKIA